MKQYWLLAIVTIFAMTGLSYAQQAKSTDAALNTLSDSVLGCEAKFDNNGDIKSMKCPGEAEMDFSDARGTRIAKQKAELRAKAQMAKFMKERLRTKEIMDDMTKTISERTGQSNESVRKTVDTHTEQISNEADALLKGVIVILVDVNKDSKVVVVHVGVNTQTMKAADQLRGKMEQNLDKGSTSSGASSVKDGTGRTIKKSKQYDEF